MKVLFFASVDSSNITYVNVYNALKNHGHECFVVVADISDDLNNKSFIIADIPFYSTKILTKEFLGDVDFAFVPMIRAQKFIDRIKILKRNRAILISCEMMSMTVSVRSDSDFIFTLNQNKFLEFSEFGLKPRMISIGDPRYDKFIQKRLMNKTSESNNIKKVLILDQGGWPFGKKGMQQFSDTIKNIAEHNPNISFEIKLRFLPNEQGKRTHTGAVCLYDFLDKLPSNLKCIDHPTVVEDIMDEYDGVILCWTTAYYAVLAAGLPMLSLEGFDSDDVFDVRTQRVKKAYDYLRASGCVRNYKDVLNQPLSLCFPNSDFAKSEIENYNAPCSEDYVSVLEFLYSKLIQEKLGFVETFQLPYKKFVETFSSLYVVDKESIEYKNLDSYYQKLNRILQDVAFRNRCLAQAYDMESYSRFYDKLKERTFNVEELNASIELLRESIKEMEDEYFLANQDINQKGRIWQFYYFEYLYRRKIKKLLNTPLDSFVCPEAYNYFKGNALLSIKRTKKAVRYFFEYTKIYIENLKNDFIDLPILRNLTLPASPLIQFLILNEFFKQNDYDDILYLYEKEKSAFCFEVITYFVMLVVKNKQFGYSLEDVYTNYNMNRPIFRDDKIYTPSYQRLINKLENKIYKIWHEN